MERQCMLTKWCAQMASANKRQQSDSAKSVTNFADAKLLPVLPRRCARRYAVSGIRAH
jgi:hypothetical protein